MCPPTSNGCTISGAAWKSQPFPYLLWATTQKPFKRHWESRAKDQNTLLFSMDWWKIFLSKTNPGPRPKRFWTILDPSTGTNRGFRWRIFRIPTPLRLFLMPLPFWKQILIIPLLSAKKLRKNTRDYSIILPTPSWYSIRKISISLTAIGPSWRYTVIQGRTQNHTPPRSAPGRRTGKGQSKHPWHRKNYNPSLYPHHQRR